MDPHFDARTWVEQSLGAVAALLGLIGAIGGVYLDYLVWTGVPRKDLGIALTLVAMFTWPPEFLALSGTWVGWSMSRKAGVRSRWIWAAVAVNGLALVAWGLFFLFQAIWYS